MVPIKTPQIILVVLITAVLICFNTSYAFDGKGRFGIGLNVGGFFPTVSDDSSPYSINNNLIAGINLDVRLSSEWGLNFSLERIKNGFFLTVERWEIFIPTFC